MPKQLTPAEELQLMRTNLGHLTFESKKRFYLDTGYPDLNTVLGHPKRGLRFGKLVELHGNESNGKSVLAYILAGLAQKRYKAKVIWLDAENSWDRAWARRWLDPDQVVLIQPYVGIFPDKKEKDKKSPKAKTPAKINPDKARLSNAQELCAEAAGLIQRWGRQHADSKDQLRIVLVVDSVTALVTREELDAGEEHQNMRTNNSTATFLSKLLRKWVGMALANNCLQIWINQLRLAPGVVYGNPEYTPGGKALKFYCHSRVKVRRVKGGRMKHLNKTIGIKGVISNIKNKLGGVEGSEVGYKIKFDGSFQFVNAEQIKKEERE